MKHLFSTLTLLATLSLSLVFSPEAQARKSKDHFFDAIVSQSQALSRDLEHRVVVTRPLLVMSSQSLDNLRASQATGRLIGELVSSSLSSEGWVVQEVRLGDSLRITQEGEHILSRDLEDLRGNFDADYVVVSTFTKSFSTLYVTLKAVRLSDGVVVASRSFVTDTPRIF